MIGLDGYIEGMDRGDAGERRVSHLYKGDFNDPGLPMCQRGWNRGEDGYSIFRGVQSPKGTCAICLRRAIGGNEGVVNKYDNAEDINQATPFDELEITKVEG